ncbi:hypothetical protein MRB53_041924 [Persea americana]|nr:hypothetical protein MRB53_041924 [Persea americana]
MVSSYGLAPPKEGIDGRGMRYDGYQDEPAIIMSQPQEDDGTDDYLHHPLPASDGLKTNGESAGKSKRAAHADIQSIQESAEIAGKVVLLSRGG